MSTLSPTISTQERAADKPLRVLLIVDADTFAGTERHVLDLALGLKGLGVDAHIGCPVPSPLAELAKQSRVEVLELPKHAAPLIPLTVFGLFRRLRNRTYDLIHAHNGRTTFLALLAVAIAGRGKCVTTQHFISPSRATRIGFRGMCSNTLHRWMAGRIGALIAISTSVADAARRRGDADPAAIHTVLNGMRLAANEENGTAVYDEFDLDTSAPLILSLARLEPEKDVATLVEAMAKVVKTCPDAVCLVAGAGSQREALQEQIETLGLEKNVRLIGFRNDTESLLAAAKLFVLPSPDEPFGLAVLEAMMARLPVVATRSGGPAEIVSAPDTGDLIPPRDPHAMADSITRYLQNPESAVEAGEAGYRRLQQNFSAERMAREISDVYRQVCY
ncbi:MAG: glycosyltransferase family 4 protein [Planctomycetota bacterium]